MEAVRRRDDDELCGFVDHRAGRWCALAIFGSVLGEHDRREQAWHEVIEVGLAALADRWTLRRGDTGDEEIVCIVEANAAEVTVARGFYASPDVPRLTITAEQIDAREWELHH